MDLFTTWIVDFTVDFLVPITIIVFLNIFLIFRLIYMATIYTLKKNIRLSQFRIYEGEFPDRLRSARQHYQNMFEIPIIFYLLCLLNIFFNDYNQLDIIFAWGFVIFRLLHFFVRLRNQKNINIIHRTFVFVVSLIFLTSGWINFIIRFI